MRKLAALLALAVAMTTVLVTVSVAPASAEKRPTKYGMSAYGFGARVKGGQLPIASGPIAESVIACNNIAGITRSNATASVEIPGLGTIEGVETTTWTRKRGKSVHSYARHRIADVQLLEAAGAKIALTGVEAWAHTWVDAAGKFHSETRQKLLGLSLTLPGQDPVELPLPDLGEPIKIPGVGRITLGDGVTKEGAKGSSAKSTGIRVWLSATDTRVILGRASTKMGKADLGVFGGIAYGVSADILGDVVGIGRIPQVFMPCEGTEGEVIEKDVLQVDVPALASVGAVSVRQKAQAFKNKASGYEMAEVADISLLDGMIEISGISARAYVRRERGKKKVIRDSTGTNVLTLKVNGEATPIPLEGLEIPGLLKIEEGIERKLKGGLEVTALRLTLLDGTGATINLGVARMRVGKLPPLR